MDDVGATIIMGISLGFCALVMIVIGVRQMKSETPVGFYTGERAVKPEEITDIPAWNRKHGIMWIPSESCLSLSGSSACLPTGWSVSSSCSRSQYFAYPESFYITIC